MIRKALLIFMLLIMLGSICGCSKPQVQQQVTLRLAAAASLEKIMTQKLIPMYRKDNPGVKLEGTYASSGKLQIQLEQGMGADVFISAANKQMQALSNKGFIAESKPLLKNELVLIVPKENSNANIKSFADFPKAKQPAIGDPRSVPAGHYAKEALMSLKLWNSVEKRASLGVNVVEVLNWVAEGSADAGLVYATDAASNDKVKVVAAAPAGAIKNPIIYPIGILKKSEKAKEAKKFAAFLSSEQAQNVFREYGCQKAE